LYSGVNAIPGSLAAGGFMFDKFQDALVVLVFFYMVYRVGWGSGMTAINTFMLLCAVVALISIALKRTGYLDRMKEKKLEEKRKLEEEKKEAK
jgi:hypothetical protein